MCNELKVNLLSRRGGYLRYVNNEKHRHALISQLTENQREKYCLSIINTEKEYINQ